MLIVIKVSKKGRQYLFFLSLLLTMNTLVENVFVSGPYVPLFGLNTEVSSANLHIQPKYGKIRTGKTLCLDTFHLVIIVKV